MKKRIQLLTKCCKGVIVISKLTTLRGCTGFDGLAEDGEAVRGRTPRKKFDLKLNAEDNLALAA